MQDWRLLREYVEQGSETAFAQLVKTHLNLVYATCLREVREPALAEDATQVVFLILARKANSIREGTPLAGWLFNTARFTAKNALKRETRRRIHEQRATEEAMSALPGEDATWSHIEPILHAGLAGLSAGDREAVLLRYYQAKSLKDTGEALGISEDAARMRVTRATEKLRRHFGKQGFAVTSVALAALLSARAAQAAPAQCLSRVLSTAPGGTPALANASLTAHLQGALRAMLLVKLKAATMFAVGTVLVLGGGGLLWQHSSGHSEVRPAAAHSAKAVAGHGEVPQIGPTPRPRVASLPARAANREARRPVMTSSSSNRRSSGGPDETLSPLASTGPRHRELAFMWSDTSVGYHSGGGHSERAVRLRPVRTYKVPAALHFMPKAPVQSLTPGSKSPMLNQLRTGAFSVASPPNGVSATAPASAKVAASSLPGGTGAVSQPGAIGGGAPTGDAVAEPVIRPRKAGKLKGDKVQHTKPLRGRVVKIEESDSAITIKAAGRVGPPINVADDAVISVDSQSSQLDSLRPGMKVIIQTGDGLKAQSIAASTVETAADKVARKLHRAERKLARSQPGDKQGGFPQSNPSKEMPGGPH